MIEILQQYGWSLLYSDGYRFTGLAITLWLLISSVDRRITGSAHGRRARVV